MSKTIEYSLNKASESAIAEHLSRCDAYFIPPLSGRVEISDYAKKITGKAVRFEAWAGGTLVGLAAAYCNDQNKHIGYLTSIGVLHDWTGEGIAARLMARCIEYAKVSGMRRLSLEVACDNMPAIKLYEKYGFVAAKVRATSIDMDLILNGVKDHER